MAAPTNPSTAMLANDLTPLRDYLVSNLNRVLKES